MVEARRPDQLFSLSDAAQLVELPVERLIELINEGKLRSYALKTQEGMVAVVHEKDLLRATLDKERYRQRYGPQTISLREAARRLEVAPSTIHRWVSSGFISRGEVRTNQSDFTLPSKNFAPPLLLADVMYYQDLLRLGAMEMNRPRGRLIDKQGNLYHDTGRS